MFKKIIIFGSAERPHQLHEANLRYKFALDYICNNESLVLDIGCGEGWGLAGAGKKSRFTAGIDYSRQAIAIAKNKVKDKENISLSIMDGSVLGFKEKIFDIVLGFEVIEHLKYPDNALKEIKRVLKEKGICIFSTPNKAYWERLGVRSSPFHIKEYSYQELKDRLGEYFEIEKFLGIFTKFKRIEQRVWFKPYMRIKKFLRLEKFTIGGEIGGRIRGVFGGSKITDYYVSDKSIEDSSAFLVVCRKLPVKQSK